MRRCTDIIYNSFKNSSGMIYVPYEERERFRAAIRIQKAIRYMKLVGWTGTSLPMIWIPVELERPLWVIAGTAAFIFPTHRILVNIEEIRILNVLKRKHY